MVTPTGSRPQPGFTLIELLVVIAIIAILASILFPVFSRAREKARQVSCVSNQRQIAISVTMHLQEHDEKFPDAVSVWNDVDNPMLLKCLTKGKSAGNAYVYNLYIAGKSAGQIRHHDREIVSADGNDHTFSVNGQPASNILENPGDIEFRHGSGEGFIASFCDGHAQLVKEIPPMWVVDISTAAEFDREVLRSTYPVLVYVYTGTATATPEYEYCQRIGTNQLIMDLATTNRLAVKIVTVNGDQVPTLLTTYSIVPGDQASGYPAFLFFNKGSELNRLTGYPPDTTGWTDDDWLAELALCKQQVQQRIDAQ